MSMNNFQKLKALLSDKKSFPYVIEANIYNDTEDGSEYIEVIIESSYSSDFPSLYKSFRDHSLVIGNFNTNVKVDDNIVNIYYLIPHSKTSF